MGKKTGVQIEKNVPRGMDIDAYVKIGDQGVKTSQRQMDDPTGGYVFMKYDALSKKLYRKNMLIDDQVAKASVTERERHGWQRIANQVDSANDLHASPRHCDVVTLRV
jgi:hypothetical protein